MAGLKLAGKVAVVTGASSGIGRGIALAFAKEGAKVAVCARRAELLESVKAEVEALSKAAALAVVMDVCSRESVSSGMAEVERQLGKVDLLVNCAGVMYFSLMKNAEKCWAQWEQTCDVNCKGTVNCCAAVFGGMVERRAGHIVNISSDAARTVFPCLAVYNASKAFVQTFSKSLRAEAVGTGVRVTDVQPGDVRTDLVVNNTDQEAADRVGVAIGQTIGTGAERGSCLDVEDVAAAVMYAVLSPAHVGVHEVLVEPVDQMFGDPTAMNEGSS
uniref:NADP-dependent 3-hydroxy acid dehydrogenase YdfG n=1 Tax=Alexandrium pacificum TaxID=1565494 RepID=A0AA51N607_9DINO|nr:sxtU protein [Alexandrium pacificum]